jgi:mono/diheme cytochrome c family protein
MRRTFERAWGLVLLLATLVAAGCGSGGAGGSTASAPAATVLAAPSALVATGGINKVTLAWDQVPGADYYNIYWSTNPGVTKSTVYKITTALTPYQQSGLSVSQTYYYVVTAVNDAGESAPSSQAATVVATDGAGLYQNFCANCHGPLATTSIKEGTPDNIRAAIAADRGGMGWLSSFLSSQQIDLIAQQLPCH